MSTLLMGAFFLASTSMFVSCKDYDDDINANTKAIQNVESSLKAQIAELNSALQQEKTAATAAHSQYADAIAKAQAAADAANKSLSDALLVAATHATTSYVDDAVSKGTADKATVDQLNDAISKLQTTLNAAIDGKASTADLNSAIAAVNDKIAALQGDIAAATNAQNTLSATLTAAINAVDQKVDTKASTEAVAALETVLKNVQQSMQTKADVQEAIAAATANLATNASVAEKIQAAADAAKADVNLAKADLQAYADKAVTAAAAQAKAEAKAEAIQAAKENAENIQKQLQAGIDANSKEIQNQVATLIAQIAGVRTDLVSLIDINKNNIEKNLGAIENINVEIDALKRFTGYLEDKNVYSLTDSIGAVLAQLNEAKVMLTNTLGAQIAQSQKDAEGYAAALAKTLNQRVDSLKNATTEDISDAAAAVTLLLKAYVDDLDVPTLASDLNKLKENVGTTNIADLVANLEEINKTLYIGEDGKIINLQEVLQGLKDDTQDVADDLADFQDDFADFKAAYDEKIPTLITKTEAQQKVDDAIEALDLDNKLALYVAKADLAALVVEENVKAAMNNAGFALKSDVTDLLTDYLKTDDFADQLAANNIIGKDKVQEIADDAQTAATDAAIDAIQAALDQYDQDLAAQIRNLFGVVEDANADDAEAITIPEEAKKALEELQQKLNVNDKGISENVANEIDNLWIAIGKNLTSLVFYPENYYGGIEAIEVTAMKIYDIFKMKDATKEGTIDEEFKAIDVTGKYDIYPDGYAKYHVNPANVDLNPYTLSFYSHVASTRSGDFTFEPADAAAMNNYNKQTGLLEVKFKNSKDLWDALYKTTGIPTFAHHMTTYSDGTDGVEVATHQKIGDGDYGKGIVTALVAKNEKAESENTDVASDYALLVPNLINRLVLVSADPEHEGLINEVEQKKTNWVNTNYHCLENNTFHLYTVARERANIYDSDDEIIGDNSELAISKLYYANDFNLDSLVETHYVNGNDPSLGDTKVDKDLFDRLHLTYRFYPIDYTRGNNGTSETLFLTFTEKDAKRGFTGKGYFNQVTDSLDANGNIVRNEAGLGIGKKLVKDGKPVRANDGSLYRQPMVRVELSDIDDPDLVYAVGYLRLEITKDVVTPSETLEPMTIVDNLFAVCEADGDELELTWDQIQSKLNKIKDGQGLSAKAWNEYEIVGTYKGSTLLYADQYMMVGGKLIKIDQVYNSDKKDKAYFPYFNVGDFELVDGDESAGVHTKVIRWTLDGDDYAALYFDAVSTDNYDNYIDQATGLYLPEVTRYIKLHHSDSANPDLYVGLTIAPKSIRFAAGKVGAVLGSYWKKAASNDRGTDDMVLNVTYASNESGTDMPKNMNALNNGPFTKDILKGFFGEKIQLDLEDFLKDITDADLKAEAEEKFAAAKDYYADGKFYFRAPSADASKHKEEASQMKVAEDGTWKVQGVSGNVYTLIVTKRAKLGIYMDYGSSVSVIKVNDKFVEDLTDEEIEGAADEATEDNTLDQTAYKGKKVIEVMTLTNTSSTDGVTTASNITLVNTSDKVAKGFAQDMLNYAGHNQRAYNQTLTAFLVLVVDNSRVYKQPSSMYNNVVTDDGDNDGDGDVDIPAPCYILPESKDDCFYCSAIGTETGEISDIELGKFEHCYKPYVENTEFAVRFYRPIDITPVVNESNKVEDANLAQATKKTVSFRDFFTITDWAGYTTFVTQANFDTYYGITFALPEGFQASDYTQNTAADADLPWVYADADEGEAETTYEEDLKAAGYTSGEIKAPTATTVEEANAPTALTGATEGQYGTYAQFVSAKNSTDYDSKLVAEYYTDKASDESGKDFSKVTDGYATYYTAPTTTGGSDDKGYAKTQNAAGKKLSVDLNGDGDTTDDGETNISYPTTEPLSESAALAAYNKSVPASQQITKPTEPTAVAHPGTLKTWEEVAKAYVYANVSDYSSLDTKADKDALWDGTDNSVNKWNYYDYNTNTDGSYVNEPTITDAEDGGKSYTENAPAAPAVDASSTKSNRYNFYLAHFADWKKEFEAYNKALKEYKKYQEDLADYNTKLADYNTKIASAGYSEDAQKIWQAAQDDYTAFKAVQTQGKTDYLAAKKDFDDYAKATGNTSAWTALQTKQFTVTKTDDDGNKTTETMTGAQLIADYNAYLALLKAADTAANSDNANEALAKIKETLRTDLYKTSANGNPLTNTEDILALPTLKEQAPSLDIKFGSVDATKFEITYQNSSMNVNDKFHIYFPIEISYKYADTNPAGPIVKWACFTVTATKQNTNARKK